ncbi:MAG TPA: 50S ribosomal protein L11 methyltransferase [Pyrinomonadaceae bacterium]
MWYAVDLIVCEQAEEAVNYALLEAGALGTETGISNERTATADDVEPHCKHVGVTGYFEQKPDDEIIRQQLGQAWQIFGMPRHSKKAFRPHRPHPPSLLYGWHEREVGARDWLGEWKKSWRPVEVGARFVVAPPWGEVEDRPGRIIIRIEPGMAFGTGTHETTRLCLVALEKYFTGASLLDVGTGTGILAIAAAKLYAGARVEACDTDAEAVEIARENATLNGVAAQVNFRTGTIEETGASFDCVCANLTADVILPLLPALIGATCGRLILSGILDTQADTVRARLAALGIGETETVADGEWVAIIV